MNLSGEPGTREPGAITGEPGAQRHGAHWVTFTPLAFDGLGWSRITAPQQDARAACLFATAHIHLLFCPQVPLRDLDAKAELAIRELEDGALTVMVIDDRHRVDRTDLRPAPGRGEATPATTAPGTAVLPGALGRLP